MISWTRAVTFEGHRVDVELGYTKAHADVIDFRFEGHAHATWSIGRDLLAEGLIVRAGWGDVRVTPSIHGLGIYLNSPDGEAYLIFDRDHIVAFLKQTFRLVSRGHEYDGIDWDLFPRPEIGEVKA